MLSNFFDSVECGILAYLEPSRCLGRLPHLALRVVTKTGLPNLLKHSQTLALQNSDNATFDPTAYRCFIYKPIDFKAQRRRVQTVAHNRCNS